MYIYIYTRFCSQLILELLSVESIRARQLCTNDSITGRDESLEISRPEIRALCISLSLSLYLYASTNRAFISAVPFLFFSPFLFFLLPIFYIIAALASLFRSPSLPPSAVLRSLDFYLSSKLLPLCSRAHAPQRVVGNWWEGRSCKMWMDEEGGESWWRCKQRLSSAGGTGYLLQISRITWPARTAARA